MGQIANQIGDHRSGLIEYADFQLGIERVVLWQQQAVYSEDGADFLFYHVRIGVQFVMNPAGLSTRLMDGAWAGETIRDLRERIMQPRQTLRVYLGDTLVLQSPAQRPNGDRPFFTDSKNGPHPIAFNVNTIHGAKTAMGYFEIETWVNDCNHEDTPALLSHRWEMSQDINERFYTTQTVNGIAVFRSDFLSDDPNLGMRPADAFRYYLSPPIPLGFKRENVRVTMSSDGLTLRYTFTDREVDLALGRDNPVVQIKGTYKFGLHNPGGSFASFTYGHTYAAIAIQVWGKRTSSKQDLINACVKAAAGFSFGDPRKRANYFKSDITVSLDEKYVELSMGCFVDGNVATLIQGTGDAGGTISDAFKFMENFPEGIPGVADSINNPRPPDGGVRGTYTGQMVPAPLSVPCQAPGEGIPLKAKQPESGYDTSTGTFEETP